MSVFPYSGATALYEDMGAENKGAYYISKVPFASITRKRTPMELDAIKKEWDSVPHLLSGEGYISKIKDELITVPNPEFPENLIDYIKEIYDNAKVIFVPINERIRKALAEHNIPYVIIYPNNTFTCKAEWVGRAFMHDGKTKAAEMMYDWNRAIESCENDKNAFEHYVMEETWLLNNIPEKHCIKRWINKEV